AVATAVPGRAPLTSYRQVAPTGSGSQGLSTSSTKSSGSSDGVGITSPSTPAGGLGSGAPEQPVARSRTSPARTVRRRPLVPMTPSSQDADPLLASGAPPEP